jgi:hypothetical protein
LGVCDFYECGTLSKKCTGTISTLWGHPEWNYDCNMES